MQSGGVFFRSDRSITEGKSDKLDFQAFFEEKASPFGRGGIAQAMTERASPARKNRHTAISRLFGRAMLSLRLFLFVSVLALSVTFGDSSPKGRA